MADTEVEEPQFTSLSARIAALKQQGVSSNTGGAPQSSGKRPPPPLPPSANRPRLPTRTQTANNPPIKSNGSSTTTQANHLPVSARGTPLLPPPGVDRDRSQNRPSSPGNTAITPSLPSRPGPPRLPSRKATELAPSLPPRNGSTQEARRDSNASTLSLSSTKSWGQAPSSASSVDSQRRLPPTLDSAKLPPLPPTRRELEQRRLEEEANAPPKIPLVSVKSAPNVALRPPPAVDRDLPPKMPSRPANAPRMPARQSTNNVEEDQAPKQPPRRLPPPAIAKSALSMGFSNRSGETPNPAPRPPPAFTRPAGPAVQELNDTNFDSIVMSGKATFLDCYAPFCKYCVELEPKWKQLGETFAFASDRLVIAKMDVHKYKTFTARLPIEGYPTLLYFDGRSDTPQKCPFYSDFDHIIRFLEEKSGISAADAPKSNGTPPPINLSSKPSRSEIEALQSRPVAAAAAPSAAPSGCLFCRDFSSPDRVAAQYPRSSLPRTDDNTGYLADVLCGPFQSATDKARAIFTWLHHNVAYDTVGFFGGTVNYGATPQDTIASGLAVCGGYAGLFEAVALKAGLKAVMVTGHGKGYGHTPLKPGDPIPPCEPKGHAWNAVRIDGGEWKLLDACWGAGNVGNQVYNKHFTPTYFTMPNEQFGIKHFPADNTSFYRSDGKIPTWAEYMIGPAGAEALEVSGVVDSHGLSQTSFSPAQKHIPVNSDETIRFQFSKVCEHWDHEKNGEGKPYPMILKINGVDGRKEDYVAFENNDFWYWIDIRAKDLGAPGQKISCFAVTTVNGKDCRGLTRTEYLNKKGRVGMGFAGICAWELV